MRAFIFQLLIFFCCGQLLALEYLIPSGAELIEEKTQNASIAMPKGKYGLTLAPSQNLTGQIERKSWRIEGSENAEGVLNAMVINFERQDFQRAFECASQSCGGFDFVYRIETSPPPNFQINLDEFYYVDLRRDEFDAITILVSSVGGDVYVQQTYIQSKPAQNVSGELEIQTEKSFQTASDDRIILSGLSFPFGSSEPDAVPDQDFAMIAERLRSEPDTICYIVGHTDQAGSLAGNIKVSRARAQAARNILINEYAVPPDQLIADGVGFLAPLATNTTEEGRAKNRRVEAVFLNN